MQSLDDVIQFIVTSRMPLQSLAVPVRYWEGIRDECRYMCEENDEPFSCDPKTVQPNFLVMGVPIIAAGSA